MTLPAESPPDPADAGPPRRTEALVVLLSVVVFAGLVWRRALAHPFPFYDDVAYLTLASDVRELGGPLALLRGLLRGTYLEGNRQPLYLALLALLPDGDAAYHLRAQALTACCGVAALLSFWRFVRRQFGAQAGLLGVALFATSETLVDYSSRETCEPLLVALSALAIGAILDGDRDPRAWIVAGAWSGLAFLCKGTAIALPICFAISVAIRYRRRALRIGRIESIGGFFIAFTLVASPLIVRNLRVFQTPVYNVNSRFLWTSLHDFAEAHAPHASEHIVEGARAYLARATPAMLLERLGSGIVETIFHIGDSLSVVSTAAFGPLHIALTLVGVGAFGLALSLLVRAARSWMRTFLLVQVAWFCGFFVFFNAVGGSSRYVFPMTMTLAAILVDALARRPVGARRRALRSGVGIAVSAAVIVALARPIPPLPAGFAETQRWLAGHVAAGEGFAIDSRSRLQPAWLLRGARQVVVSSSFEERPVPASELVAWFRERRVRYVVLDASSRRNRSLDDDPADRRYFFYDRLPLAADGSLPSTGFPDDLEIAWADPATPRRWVVLTWKGGHDGERPPPPPAPSTGGHGD